MTMPREVTEADRRAAFARFALKTPKYTNYEAAMACYTVARVINIMAAQAVADEFRASHQRTVVPVRRCQPGADGHPLRWCTQLAPGAWQPITQPDFLNIGLSK